MEISLTAVPHIPDVQPGDDVAELILTALAEAGVSLQDGDILAIAQKIVSKAEGRLVHLADVVPGPDALEVAAQTDKDPRIVELILRESDEISRLKPGVLVVRHKLGFTSANAGIDRSNVGSEGDTAVLLLPADPDASAAAIRQAIRAAWDVSVGVVITDS
ncbi:MAG: coenzyme F420-0:L-glutamate ligase, partial [Anaerolineales bacterium]|nr:coenzyme F420-0:L-glutamate ligase [Anaerolineales bacterium]